MIWNDAFVGKNAQVRGAVLGRRVDVRARASIEVGAVIGDESMVGQGAQVMTGVQVYPYKRIEPAAVVGSSIIWESLGARSLFGDDGISGLVGVDITPEMALKAAQAFGSTLPRASHVIVSRDSSRAARMVKRAMVSGFNSAGCNVRDLRVASPAINRFTSRDTRCVGGVHICQSSLDRNQLEIHFYEQTGLDLSPGMEKKVERLFFRGEFRRAFLAEVGDIIYPPRAIEYYAAGLRHALERRQNDALPHLRVVADLNHGVASLVLPQVSAPWHLELVTLNPFLDAERTQSMQAGEASTDAEELAYSVEMFNADLGVRFDAAGEHMSLVTSSGRLLDGETALLAMADLWCRTDGSGLPLAAQAQATAAMDAVAERHGRKLLRPGRTHRALAGLALDGEIGFAGNTAGGYIFSDFLAAYDAVMSLGMLTHMLAKTGESLDDVVDSLPESHLVFEEVFCPVHRKGAVMRAITEATTELDTDLTEGVKAFTATGWVLVLPHAADPSVLMYAEGSDAKESRQLLDEWRDTVERAIAGE